MWPIFVNSDWGTTNFRLRAVRREDCAILSEFRSDQGVARLAERPPADRPEQYRAVLTAGIEQLAGQVAEPLADAPVMISGMASSSLGWQELPYVNLPLGLDGAGLLWRELEPVESAAGRHRVALISGARTATDVMRGEETEVLGLFQLPAALPLQNRSLVLKPGTHAKHIRIEAGQMAGFQTFMTGELFSVLSEHSILRHSVHVEAAEEAERANDERDRAFREGVEYARQLPLSAALFRVRTRQVLDGVEPSGNRAFLSGVLLGSELAYLHQAELRDQPLLLAGAAGLVRQYRLALESLGLAERLLVVSQDDFDRLTALGQRLVLEQLG